MTGYFQSQSRLSLILSLLSCSTGMRGTLISAVLVILVSQLVVFVQLVSPQLTLISDTPRLPLCAWA